LSSYPSIVDLYNATARGYDELYRDEQYSKYKFVFSRGFTPKGTVVDIGCGTGLLYEYIVSMGYTFTRYLCIEPSPQMIYLSLRKCKGDPRTFGIMGYGENVGLRDGVADTIYSFTVLDNVEKKYWPIFIGEIVRLLNTHGYAILSFLRHGWRDKLEYLRKINMDRGLEMKFLGCNRYDCFIVFLGECCVRE